MSFSETHTVWGVPLRQARFPPIPSLALDVAQAESNPLAILNQNK